MWLKGPFGAEQVDGSLRLTFTVAISMPELLELVELPPPQLNRKTIPVRNPEKRTQYLWQRIWNLPPDLELAFLQRTNGRPRVTTRMTDTDSHRTPVAIYQDRQCIESSQFNEIP